MAASPDQKLKMLVKRGLWDASNYSKSSLNDVYADWGLRNNGAYSPYSSSVASGRSPKFSNPYSYEQLVALGMSTGAPAYTPNTTNLGELQRAYDTATGNVFKDNATNRQKEIVGKEQGVHMTINGKDVNRTPSELIKSYIDYQTAIQNPDAYEPTALKEHLYNLSNKDFDNRKGFVDRVTSTGNKLPQYNTVAGYTSGQQAPNYQASTTPKRQAQPTAYTPAPTQDFGGGQQAKPQQSRLDRVVSYLNKGYNDSGEGFGIA